MHAFAQQAISIDGACVADASECLVLNEGTSAIEGASCFVNPLTVLGMVGTMRLEGHRALVHTAAASNLGQMLVKVCQAESVPLVNIVRRAEQVELLRSLGAEYVCNTSDESFMKDLMAALDATDATLGFDATGGGRLASQILTAMEAVQVRKQTTPGAYGSSRHKQVYIYGRLEFRPTELGMGLGMAWGVGGWLVSYFLKRIGPEATAELKQRVADEIKTTFASHYTRIVSLAEALSLDSISAFEKKSTGEKYLINPNKDL